MINLIPGKSLEVSGGGGIQSRCYHTMCSTKKHSNVKIIILLCLFVTQHIHGEEDVEEYDYEDYNYESMPSYDPCKIYDDDYVAQECHHTHFEQIEREQKTVKEIYGSHVKECCKGHGYIFNVDAECTVSNKF